MSAFPPKRTFGASAFWPLDSQRGSDHQIAEKRTLRTSAIGGKRTFPLNRTTVCSAAGTGIPFAARFR